MLPKGIKISQFIKKQFKEGVNKQANELHFKGILIFKYNKAKKIQLFQLRFHLNIDF